MSSYLSYNLQIKIFRMKCFLYNFFHEYFNTFDESTLEYLRSRSVIEPRQIQQTPDAFPSPSAPSLEFVECPVCLDNVICNDDCCKLKCGHEYHLKCIFELYDTEGNSSECIICE